MTVQNFNSSQEVAKDWWAMKNSLLPKFRAAIPNQAHAIFARLHDRGLLGGIITQNIDSLHQRAGVPDDLVVELHGNMRDFICSDHITALNPIPFGDGICDYRLPEAEAKLAGYEALPLCPRCGCPLRVETVMFGQPMPADVMDSRVDMIRDCDLLLVIGSTLIVQPANVLPGVALHHRKPVVIINYGDETQYDEFADGLVCGPAGEFLSSVMQLMEM